MVCGANHDGDAFGNLSTQLTNGRHIIQGKRLSGLPIRAEMARSVADAARAEATKRQWKMTIAIAGPSGDLVFLDKMDGAQASSVQVALAKARAAAVWRRPTKVFSDAVGGGRNVALALPDAIPRGGVSPSASVAELLSKMAW